MGEQTLLRSVLVVEIGMFGRQTCVLSVVILGYTKLAAHSQVVGSKPFGYEIVGEAEALTLVKVVEMVVPQGI